MKGGFKEGRAVRWAPRCLLEKTAILAAWRSSVFPEFFENPIPFEAF
jgi:hypothetical protein